MWAPVTLAGADSIDERDQAARGAWPQSKGTLRGFVSALLLPIALFLIQRGLAQFL